MTSVARLSTQLAEVGCECSDVTSFRHAVIALVGDTLGVDAAFLHSMKPQSPLEEGVWRGIPVEAVAASRPRWAELEVELLPLRREVERNGGIACDRDVFTRAELDALPAYGQMTMLQQIDVSAVSHLVVGGHVAALFGLGRRGRRARFTRREVDLVRQLLPVIALGDARLAVARVRGRSLAFDSLTSREREICELVVLGHTNGAIAGALGLSLNTVRNRLVGVFQKLEAGSRAELVSRLTR